MPRSVRILPILLILFAFAVRAEDAAPDLKEVRAFAEKLQADLIGGKLAEFDGAFDLDALTARVLKQYPQPDAYSQDFTKGFKQLFQLGRQIAGQLGAPSGFKLMKVRAEGGEARATFRFITGSGALDYHDYVIKGAAGSLKVQDLYMWSKGEYFSGTLMRVMFPNLFAVKKKEKPLGDDEKALELRYEAAKAFRQLVVKGDYAAALAFYDAMPADQKKLKSEMVLRVAAAEQAGDEPLKKAMAEFEAAYPADPTFDLATLDTYLKRKDWDAVHKSLDRLAAFAGPDAYLDFLHANTCIVAGKFADAQAAAEKSIAAEPALQDPYLSLITVTLKGKDFNATAQALARFEKQFGKIEADITKLDDYAEFLKSPAYAGWKKTHDELKSDAPK
ncbi:MAG: hypothetical protein HY291_03070 [Planctomycetes bacterium]|nr:hypothetical protein [Planctomycetota bacterium]